VLERINTIFPLPDAHWDKLPSFEQMKNRINKYGSGAQLDISNIEKLKLSNKISEKANLELERRDA
jgi:hypothetical protein